MIPKSVLPFVIGTDLTVVARFRRDNLYFKRFIRRIIHPVEFRDLGTRFPAYKKFLFPAANEHLTAEESAQMKQGSLASWLAGRWAAKEAAKKAWGANILGYKDLYVTYTSNRPIIVCSPFREPSQSPNTTDSSSSDNLPIEAQTGQLSISHDGDYLVATVLAEPLRADLQDYFSERQQKVTAAFAEMEPGTINPELDPASLRYGKELLPRVRNKANSTSANST